MHKYKRFSFISIPSDGTLWVQTRAYARSRLLYGVEHLQLLFLRAIKCLLQQNRKYATTTSGVEWRGVAGVLFCVPRQDVGYVCVSPVVKSVI